MQSESISEADLCTGMNTLIVAVNQLTKKATEERKTFLPFLWACYGSLPTYVNSDPSQCNFPESSDIQYDQYSLCYDLGSAIASFLCGGQEAYCVVRDGVVHVANALSGDGKGKLYIFNW